ncbi:MAG: hypothetical protein WB384_06125 [Candidatus Sulfotelmatobacter sp.]
MDHHANGNANAETVRVVQVIPAVDVINVNVVSVVPTCRPRLSKSEPIAALLEARVPADEHWLVDYEPVPITKIGAAAIRSRAGPDRAATGATG